MDIIDRFERPSPQFFLSEYRVLKDFVVTVIYMLIKQHLSTN